jgi:hypothetical protein
LVLSNAQRAQFTFNFKEFMPKGERKQVDSAANTNMAQIQSGLLGTTQSTLQSEQPAAQAQATSAYGTASSGASNLASGTANPYATNLAVTGGISDQDAQKMETTATRGVRSVYDVLGAEAKRKQAITGGYGGSGEIAQMARQSGQKQAEALTTADANIASIRQQGQIAGSGQVGQQQIAGVQNLTQQYGLSAQQAQSVMDQLIKAQTSGAQLTQGDIDLLAQMSKEPSALSGALGNIGQIAGIGAGLAAGIGG